MKIVVMRRVEAQEFTAPEGSALKYAVISIVDPDQEMASFKPDPNRLGILRLKFHDVGHETEPVPRATYFGDREAERLVQDVKRMINIGCDTFVVHCEAGISRSRGIAAAMEAVHGNTYREPEGAARTNPNPHVVRTYLKAHDSVHGTTTTVPERFATSGYSPNPQDLERKQTPSRGFGR